MNDPGAPTGGVVEEGGPAPDFTLTSDSGEAVTVSSFRGAPVVLYFYPWDDTPSRFNSNRRSRPTMSAAL
jgi:peroxiredoxin